MFGLMKRIYHSNVVRRLLTAAEWVAFGGRARRGLLEYLLDLHYRSKFRRDWVWSDVAPHFSDFERFEAILKDPAITPYIFYRGVLTAEVLRHGDRMLDIGCGSGFFVQRFYSHKCCHIDALDIEPSAISYASRFNSGSNIHYHLRDAVDEDFPAGNYDVVAWDGAIGHFSEDVTDLVLEKIRASLAKDGVFVGSESLGREGHDHLQFFDTASDLARILKKHFAYVAIREAGYPIGGGYLRIEAYWRCSNSESLFDRMGWQRY